jgi:integrase
VNLGIVIGGIPPKTLRDFGDIAFERSRVKAQEKLNAIVDEAKTAKHAERILERLYEHKTGDAPPSVPLHELIERWKQIPRGKQLCEQYVAVCSATLRRFLKSISEINANVIDLTEVTLPMITAFLEAEERRGVAPKTYNASITLLKTMWKNLLPGFPNPLLKIPSKKADTRFRRPCSEDQLQKILVAAQNDLFIYPIIVTGMCTAMRRGDCCGLRWNDVDMQGGFISVVTAKNRARVEIPIWPLFSEVLKLAAKEKIDEFVFSKQAAMYRRNPDGITMRVKKILRQAGILAEDSCNVGPRLRNASAYDFHSFRVTWVTLALSSGVPIELVRRVTGHSTVEVVLRHYHQPERDHFRRVLEDKMPAFMAARLNGSAAIDDAIGRLKELIVDLDRNNFSQRRGQILEIVR